MARSKKGSPDKSSVKALALGVSLSLAGAACAKVTRPRLRSPLLPLTSAA